MLGQREVLREALGVLGDLKYESINSQVSEDEHREEDSDAGAAIRW